MSRDYKEMPPLWYLQQQFQLSDQYPSGLEWRVKRAGYQIGDAVGCKNRTNNLYTVYVWGEKYLAHRIVWYLRTGQCPDGHAVEHDDSNPGKDNRLGLRVSYVANKKRTLLVRLERRVSLRQKLRRNQRPVHRFLNTSTTLMNSTSLNLSLMGITVDTPACTVITYAIARSTGAFTAS